MDIAINTINLIPSGISTSVPTDIYISTDDNLVDPSYRAKSLDSFVTVNQYPSFDREKKIYEDFKVYCITSKYSDNITDYTT